MQTTVESSVAVSRFEMPEAALPSLGVQRFNNSGKSLGHRYSFGKQSASELRAALRKAGHKGKELTARVEAALFDESKGRQIMDIAAVIKLGEMGYHSQHIDTNKSGSTAAFRFVKIAKPQAAVETEDQSLLRMAGGDVELAANMKAMIDAKRAAAKSALIV